MTENPQPKRPGRRKAIIWGLLLLVGMGTYAFVRLWKPEDVFLAVPSPNGYDLIVRAAQQIGEPSEDWKTMSDADLEAFLTNNAPAIRSARAALDVPSVVPVALRKDWLANHLDELSVLKNLSRAIAIEARLHQFREEREPAATAALDLLKLSRAVSHGGMAIDWLVAMAFEVQGVTILTNVLDQLPREQSRAVIAVLGRIDAEREPVESVLAREKAFALESDGPMAYICWMIQSRSWRPEDVLIDTSKMWPRVRNLRTIQIRAAARAFAVEQGRAPTNATELVPEYLPEVPRDPETDQLLELGDPLS